MNINEQPLPWQPGKPEDIKTSNTMKKPQPWLPDSKFDFYSALPNPSWYENDKDSELFSKNEPNWSDDGEGGDEG